MATNALEVIGPVPRGRPSSFSQEMADFICDELAKGRSLTMICANEDMPTTTTVYNWLNRNEEFFANYTRARQLQATTFADQIQDIADCPFLPPAHKAQMIDARKWRAARQNWRAWGDKVQHEHTANLGPAAGQDLLPPGLGFLAGKLPKPDATG